MLVRCRRKWAEDKTGFRLDGIFIGRFRSLLLHSAFYLLHFIKSREHSQQDVEREKNRCLMKHPFGQTLKKCSAHAKENSNADSPHWIRASRQKKTDAHLNPAEPQQYEQSQSSEVHL